MAIAPKVLLNWRFGVFEVDGRTAELRRSGAAVRLQEQPAQLLVYLLEHAGQIVTRNELRQRLWPADTFVDFDHALNTAVMKLREALGDSSERPLYIQTIPRKGYRFVAPVMEIPRQRTPAPAIRRRSLRHPPTSVSRIDVQGMLWALGLPPKGGSRSFKMRMR
jgi:DNA-binding winged helix-turn-helix (wHTH) protein